jgi:homoserine dehydrogenase
MSAPELALVLIGFGRVARRFVRLLDETSDRLAFACRIVGISTRRHGSVVDAAGVDGRRAAAVVEAGQSLDRLDPAPLPRSGLDALRSAADRAAGEAAQGRLVAIESTVLEIERGEPAVSHVKEALEGSMHVVTVNKGPIAFAYRELAALAGRVERMLLFEGVVMDGVPVFNLVRHTLPAVHVTGFRGVLNTTSNYVLSALERGQAFEPALREMQARGIAEADPSLDVDGWDAAAKTAALVNVLMGGAITPHQVQRTGIGGIAAADIRDAAARDRRIRLVASARRQGESVAARVEPEVLDRRDPLAALDDTENAVYLRTDLLGEIGIVQRSGDLTQTAYAVIADLSAIARGLATGVVR